MATLKRALGAKLAASIQARAGVDSKVPTSPWILSSEDSPQDIRRKNFGQYSRPRTPIADVFQDEITQAVLTLDTGRYHEAARIAALTMSDSWVSGVMGSLCSSVSNLPRVFQGDDEAKRDLARGYSGADGDPRSLFDVMVRPSVIREVARDLRFFNTALCELVWLEDLDFPILSPMDLRYLWQDSNDGRWYYDAATGQPLGITPGDGRFVLFSPSPNAPWKDGVWSAVARDYARKQEAALNLDEWQRRHASPIRKGTAPAGAAKDDAAAYLEQLIKWTGTNSSVVLPPGWDLSLVETLGQGYQSYGATVSLMNESITIGIAGQSTTTVGAPGFANGDIGLTVRSDLRDAIADEIAFTLTEQVMPHFMWARYGSVDRRCSFQLKTEPKEQADTSAVLVSFANAAKALADAKAACQAVGIDMPTPDIAEMMKQAGVPELPALPASEPAVSVSTIGPAQVTHEQN